MKIEEIERLAVAATASSMEEYPKPPAIELAQRIAEWRSRYLVVLAEFIEQEKLERDDEDRRRKILTQPD